MAEAFLFNIADRIICILGSSVLQEVGLFWNVKDELARIKSTISTVRAVLLDAEDQKTRNHAVRDWLEKLKDAVFEADDLLDDFSTEALRREVMTRNKKAKKVSIFLSKSNPVAYGLKMGHKIKKIRKELDAIAEDRMKFHFTERTNEKQVQNRERQHTYSFVREEEVIGREAEKTALIDFLLESEDVEDNVSVIPIVGIGGLGKTTLAQLVYNDEIIQNHFELKLWVCVFDNFELKNIVEKIVGIPTNSEMEQLQKDLRKKIKGKRYLLVLDDVWNENRDMWFKLKSLLMDGAKGSKVIITTRIEMVAKITGTISPFYLQGLDEYKSWALFTRMSFEKGEEPKNGDDLIAIGKEIVTKCAGVPLAIRTIGSLLYFKSSENDWLYFKNNDLSKINPQDNTIFSILKLSYDQLPSYLKNCFAYCSLLPKDHIIQREKLIQLCMAQGFIQSLDEDRCLEDVGQEYFMALYWRSFFQDIERDIYGDISWCKMHDLIHDLAQFVAGNECTIGNVKGENISIRTRHVSVGFSLDSSWRIPTPMVKANKLRTFLLPFHKPAYPNEVELNRPVYDLLISSFKCLRMLDLHGLNNVSLPDSIGLLKHLRYLDLSENRKIEMLPRSISNLHNLQTLKLSWCERLKELPRDIRKMTRLRHLELDVCYSLTHMPRGLGLLTSLQTLTTFVLDKKNGSSSKICGGISELSGINDLRGSFAIEGLKHLRCNIAEVKAANIIEKRFLKSLTLGWGRMKVGEDNDQDAAAKDELLLEGLQPHSKLKSLKLICFGGVRFSGWLSSLSNLVQIDISDCHKLQHLPPLHQLPYLESVDLSNMRSLEYIDNDGSEEELSSSSQPQLFFPSLKRLTLRWMHNLRGWWRKRRTDETAAADKQHNRVLIATFPCLSEIEIHCCPNLTYMPLYPHVEKFSCHEVSEKILRQLLQQSPTITAGRQADTLQASSLSHSPLLRLRSLDISNIDDLEYFPTEWLPNPNSLQDLTFNRCHRLKSLSLIVQHFTALHQLVAFNCDKLNLSNDELDGDYGMLWKELRCLNTLAFRHLPKMVSLPEGLQYVTALQHLKISDCDNLLT
ncbi:Disease resistance protein [Quillaja saponaria]|uniref:Disease resistance protein n=1 Tax=Quillaja saponaria TaxID=32244 RepID=A0AAD7PB69_QUISA|nr:Disease resistance protein [Quillaja saponaria]